METFSCCPKLFYPLVDHYSSFRSSTPETPSTTPRKKSSITFFLHAMLLVYYHPDVSGDTLQQFSPKHAKPQAPGYR
eukprot:scaffold992_cov175-Amphora_coffeaeformis.AAC.9